MIFGQHRFGIIQTTKRHVDFFGIIVKLARQGRAAGRAKVPRAPGGGSKPRRLTRQEPETGFEHTEPDDEGSPAGPSANRTVAIGFMKKSSCRLVANGPTKTPALHH